jgi:hypothetical protein
MSQRSVTVSVPAAIECRVGSSTRCPPASGVASAATHAPDRDLGVAGPDARERGGQQRGGLPDVPGDDVDQRLNPCGVGVVSGTESARPGAIEELAGVRSVTGDEPLVERVRPAQAHHYG